MDLSDRPSNDARGGFERLAQEARVSYRLVKDDEMVTEEKSVALIGELKDYRVNRRTAGGKPISWAKLASELDMPASTLTEVIKNRYKGNTEKYLRRIDAFLAAERERKGRFDIRGFASIGVSEKIWGVIQSAVRHNSMAAVIGDSGCGKSVAAKAYALANEGARYVEISDAHRDPRGVAELLCQAFKLVGFRTYRERFNALRSHLSRSRSATILFDESQLLSARSLEAIRGLYDASDPDARRNTPIVFLGDEKFLRHLKKARHNESRLIAPQLARRIYPVFVVGRDARQNPDGDIYSPADIAKILRNERLRVVDSAGVRWLTMLANTRGHGMLGLMVCVVRSALDINKGVLPLRVEALETALYMSAGAELAIDINAAAGGELLKEKSG